MGDNVERIRQRHARLHSAIHETKLAYQQVAFNPDAIPQTLERLLEVLGTMDEAEHMQIHYGKRETGS